MQQAPALDNVLTICCPIFESLFRFLPCRILKASNRHVVQSIRLRLPFRVEVGIMTLLMMISLPIFREEPSLTMREENLPRSMNSKHLPRKIEPRSTESLSGSGNRRRLDATSATCRRPCRQSLHCLQISIDSLQNQQHLRQSQVAPEMNLPGTRYRYKW